MQCAEMEDEGSVLKYMTKSEIEEQRRSLLIMTQRPLHFGISDAAITLCAKGGSINTCKSRLQFGCWHMRCCKV